MLKAILVTVAGAALAMGVIYGWEVAGHRIFPLPQPLDMSDPAQRVGLVNRMPLIAQAWVIAGYVVGVAAGGLLANLVLRQRWPALVIAVIIAAAFAVTLTMMDHPLWMQVAGIVLPLLGGVGIAANAGRAASAPTAHPRESGDPSGAEAPIRS